MAKVVPGILVKNEDEYVKRLKKAEHVCDLIQVDVVDGKFAKNKTVDIEIISKTPTDSMLEIQLMVVNPSQYIKKLETVDCVSRIIFPFETDEDISENIFAIKNANMQVGLSLNFDTRVDAAAEFFDDVDFLLLMTARAGYSGQKLGANTFERIKKVRQISPELPIEIDIGVNLENARKLALAGASFLVATSALYKTGDFRVNYESLEKEARVTS